MNILLEYETEIKIIKKANIELKDTIQKIKGSNLKEKKRMITKFEEETKNYSKYHKFFNENIEKLQLIEEQNIQYLSEKKSLIEELKQVKMNLGNEHRKINLNQSYNRK